VKALILLHGRGSSSDDILSLAKFFPEMEVIAPDAPDQTWYPHSMLAESNEPKLSQSIATVNRLIEETGLPKSEICLMGFSQGACLVLEVAARHATKFGAIVAFSGGLIGKTLDEEKYHGNFQKTKIFIGISENDPYIPLTRCKESKDLLEKMGAEVTLKAYPGSSHTITKDELRLVKEFF
jgi:phospholipase/carboxylesterase